MDHKTTIVPLEGFKNGSWCWDEYILRMFCDEDGYQVLCKECHDAKSNEEKKIRAEVRKKTLTTKKK
jgi:hypothetical protein